jgi:hypothetical protein
MGALKRGWKRFTSWWGQGGSNGPGSGGGDDGSAAYNEAKFRAQMDTTRGINNV